MRFLPLCLMLLAMGSAEAYKDGANKTFIINVADSVQSVTHRHYSEALLNFIYNELDIRPEFRYLPSKRGLQMVNAGVFDAEAGRLAQVVTSFDNLLKVAEPVATFHIGIFCLKEKQCILGDGSVVTALDGFRMALPFCQKMQLTCKTTIDSQSVAKLLNEGLADALFAITLDAANILCSLQSERVFYRALPQFDARAFHYVHKKHKNLIPALEKAVILARQQGVVEKLVSFWREEVKECGVELIAHKETSNT